MARKHVHIDIEALKKFQADIDRLNQRELALMYEALIKRLAAHLLRKVIKRTPTGVVPEDIPESAKKYWEGYTGGTLRRGWTAKTEEEAKSGSVPGIKAFVEKIHIYRNANGVSLAIVNPVRYALT